MKKLEDLKEGDYIAFGFNYNGGEPNEIIVSNITSVKEKQVLSHFLYGHHSLSEFIKKEDIIAIGNNLEGEGEIKGWTGKFDILKPEKLFLLNHDCKDYKKPIPPKDNQPHKWYCEKCGDQL